MEIDEQTTLVQPRTVNWVKTSDGRCQNDTLVAAYFYQTHEIPSLQRAEHGRPGANHAEFDQGRIRPLALRRSRRDSPRGAWSPCGARGS